MREPQAPMAEHPPAYVPVRSRRMHELSAALGHPKTLNALEDDSAHDALVESAAAVLTQMRTLITAYHLALDQRQHGGTAAGTALDAIQHALGMPWVQGAALAANIPKETPT